MKLLAFDLEIAKSLPDGAADWKAQRPLGITCAATLLSDPGSEPTVWFGEEGNGDKSPQMSKEQLAKLLLWLPIKVEDGYTIITWNGAAFDFDVLAEESGQHAICADLALNHIDMMFHFFCGRGHFLGLDKAAKGLGLTGKLEGVNGALAPDLWKQGEYDTVLAYVAQDVRTTMDVALKAAELGCVQWTSKNGKRQTWDMDRWLTVTEALALPEPDNSWMTNPARREDLLGWTQR